MTTFEKQILAELKALNVQLVALRKRLSPPKKVVRFKTRKYGERIFTVPADQFHQCPSHTWFEEVEVSNDEF